MSKDIYKELKEASPEELLEALLWFYQCNSDVPDWWEQAVRLGFRIGRENGWENVAPAWLRELRQSGYDAQKAEELYKKIKQAQKLHPSASPNAPESTQKENPCQR